MDLLVVGDANADLVLRGGDIVPRFGQREQLVDHAELVLGGSGAILAAGAAKLGLDVAMVACLGDDPLGRAMREELATAGVDVGAVRSVDAPTGVSVGLVRDDDRTMLTATGALAHLRADDVPDALLQRARHVHVASPFLQDGLRPGLGALAKRASGTTSLDPGWDPRERWDIPLDAFDVLLPNAEEALRLTGEEDVEAAAHALAARGPLVVVKLGPEGALAATHTGELTRVRAPRVDAVDSTGAGDSFDAGFLAGWLRGDALKRGAHARVRVRRAQHAPSRRDRRPADARRGPRVRMIAFVAATPSIDRQHEIDALQPGTIHRPHSVVAVAGGKALNAARAANRLGGAVHAIALLGGHAGRWVADALAEEGITLDQVDGPGETRMALSVAADGPLTEFYEPAPEIGPGHWAALEREVERVAHYARWVAIAGSLPPGAPQDAYRRLAAAAHHGGAKVALDARDNGLTEGLRAGPDFVKVNTHEAAAVGIDTAQELLVAAGGGDRAAAITHGADGMELAIADGTVLRAAPPALGRYPVGSGDAALGGFLTALDVGGDWRAALSLATGAAAANAELPGAGRLDGARAAALARDVRVVHA